MNHSDIVYPCLPMKSQVQQRSPLSLSRQDPSSFVALETQSPAGLTKNTFLEAGIGSARLSSAELWAECVVCSQCRELTWRLWVKLQSLLGLFCPLENSTLWKRNEVLKQVYKRKQFWFYVFLFQTGLIPAETSAGGRK